MTSAQRRLPDGTVTLLLADVEDSSRLWQRDSTEASSAMAELEALVDEIVAKFEGGRPLEQGEGDSFLAAFARASDAIACAIEIQSRLADGPVHVRMGMHTGEVELRDRRYEGQAIIRAARVRDLGHGGQVLISAATREAARDVLPVGADLIDVGSHELKGLDRPEVVHQLVHPSLPQRFPPLRSSEAPRGNLPVRLTSFVGRERDLEHVKRMIDTNRVVTLIGAGGCGKTRLAVEASEQLAALFPDGVWFVDLGSLTAADAVAEALSNAIGARSEHHPSDTEAACVRLASTRALVVLDNCEHLIAASAELADALLRTCPQVRVLATSREPLGIEGEVAWRVPSLEAPARDVSDPRELTTFPAVQLFVERATRAHPDFDVTSENAAAVAEVCARLDGIPLALELAAARVRVMSVGDVAAGLSDLFKLLGGGARTLLPRQQTLEASVGWSYNLLSEQQRVVFRRLSVFVGGFSLKGAELVVAGDGVDSSEVLELVSQLVERSLVIAVETKRGTRYSMLETIRQFARARLAESGELPTVAVRHLDAFDWWTERALGGTDLIDAFELLELEYENLRAAVEWALEEGRSESGLRIVVRMCEHRLHTSGARIREARRWLRGLMSQPETIDPATLGLAYAAVSLVTDDPTLSMAALTEAESIGRETGDLRVLARALVLMGGTITYVDLVEGENKLNEGIALAREADDWKILLEGLIRISFIKWQTGELMSAIGLIDELITVSTRQRNAIFGAIGRFVLGNLLLSKGDVAAAVREMQAAMSVLDEAEDAYWTASCLVGLAETAIFLGDSALARTWLRRASTTAATLPSSHARTWADLHLARVEMMEGHYDDANDLLSRYASIQPASWLDRVWVAEVQSLRALGLMAAGDVEGARRSTATEQTIDLAGHNGLHGVQMSALVARASGEISEAESLLRRTLEAVARSALILAPDTLEIAAAVRADVGAYADATRLFAAAAAARARMGIIRQLDRAWDVGAEIAAVRERLGSEVFDEAWAAGEALTLEDAVAYAMRGRGKRQRPQTGWDSLTPTERKIAELVAQGLSNPQIADRLFISWRTVSSHLTRVFAKLGMSSRAELAAETVKRGI